MANTKKKSHYISGRETRKIARYNRKVTKQFEKRKVRKDVEAEYLTEMKNPKNIVEFDNLNINSSGKVKKPKEKKSETTIENIDVQ